MQRPVPEPVNPKQLMESAYPARVIGEAVRNQEGIRVASQGLTSYMAQQSTNSTGTSHFWRNKVANLGPKKTSKRVSGATIAHAPRLIPEYHVVSANTLSLLKIAYASQTSHQASLEDADPSERRSIRALQLDLCSFPRGSGGRLVT